MSLSPPRCARRSVLYVTHPITSPKPKAPMNVSPTTYAGGGSTGVGIVSTPWAAGPAGRVPETDAELAWPAIGPPSARCRTRAVHGLQEGAGLRHPHRGFCA